MKTETERVFNILNLKPFEINDPFLVFESFFNVDSLEGHLERLKEWRRCILSDEYFKGDKGSPAELLSFHELNIRLLEAAYMIKENNRKANKSLFAEGKLPQRKFGSSNEVTVSDLSLIHLFNDYSLHQYREKLYEWLEYGLSSKAADEFIQTADLISVYENLQKLYNVAWLLHQRSISKPSLNSDMAKEKNSMMAPALNLSTIQLYQPNTEIKPEQRELISNLTAIIKHKVTTVQAIIYLGVNPIQPGKLFMLILTDDTEQRHALSLSSHIEESCYKAGSVTALCHYSSAFIKSIKENNLFFNNTLNCPAIYLRGDLLLPIAEPMSRISQDHDERLLWERWHQQGKDFFSGAEFYIKANANGPALFLMHQCVESILVAIIRAVLGYRINAHNLAKLLSITQLFTEDIAAIFGLEDAAGKQQFRLLMDAYINVRYKDNYEPDTRWLQTLFEIIQRFVVVTEKVREKHLMMYTL